MNTIEIKKQYDMKRYANIKDKIKKQQKAYRIKNKEKISKRFKKWYKENRIRIRIKRMKQRQLAKENK